MDDPVNVVEARQCVASRNRAGIEFRQPERNLLGKIAKLVSRQEHQFGNRPRESHRFLHRLTAPIAAF